MKQDRFLIGILAFISLLVVAAVILFFVRRGAPAYEPEDTPQGVLHNYAVALQTGGYERAYGYLEEAENKPTLDDFRRAFLDHQLDVSGSAIQINRLETVKPGEAVVDLTIYSQGADPLFVRSWASNGTALLTVQDGAWRITSMPYPYWGWNWYQPTPVK